MRTQSSLSVKGFTLVEVMVVVAIIALLIAIAVPNFIKIRSNAQTKTCVANLGQIESAKQIWGLENQKITGDGTLESDLVPTYIKKAPACPSGGVYDYKPIGQNPTCTTPGHTF